MAKGKKEEDKFLLIDKDETVIITTDTSGGRGSLNEFIAFIPFPNASQIAGNNVISMVIATKKGFGLFGRKYRTGGIRDFMNTTDEEEPLDPLDEPF